jgi:hypothetical protein
MTALAQNKKTDRKTLARTRYLKLGGTEHTYNGGIVSVLTSDGFLIPGADTAGTVVMGIALEEGDNSAGSDGDLSIEVGVGVYKFATSGGNPLVQASVGALAYVLDDQTAVLAAGVTNNVILGLVEEMDDDGDFWIAVGFGYAW